MCQKIRKRSALIIKGEVHKKLRIKKRGTGTIVVYSFISTNPQNKKKDKYLHLWWEDSLVVTGPDRECVRTQPWIACVFRRAPRDRCAANVWTSAVAITYSGGSLVVPPTSLWLLQRIEEGRKDCRRSLPDLMCWTLPYISFFFFFFGSLHLNLRVPTDLKVLLFFWKKKC